MTPPAPTAPPSSGEDLRSTVRRMRRQQEAISRASLSDAFVTGDIDQLAREVTELAAKTVGVERANAWLFNEDGTELRCVDLFEATPARHSAGTILSESEYRAEFAALKEARFVDADDPLTDPRTAGYVDSYLKPLRITAMLDAVIEVSGHRLGVLCLEHVDRPHHWERDEVSFACQLADKIALALVNRARRDAQDTLRASEVRYRRLFESAKDGILILDAETAVIVDVNPYLADLIGYTRAEILGHRVWDLGFLKDLLDNEDNFRKLIQNEYIRYDNLALKGRGGRRVEVEFISNVYLVNEKRVVQCNIRDITERRAAELALEASLLEKQALLREVHHRVKNNLQVITSLLRLEAGRSEGAALLRVLKDMQGRILSMALLHETLYRSGDFGRVQLESCVRQLSQQLFRAHGAESGETALLLDLGQVQVDIDQAIPCGLIVNELLTNSLKHAFSNGPGGEVKVVLRPEGEDQVFLEVSDNGAGLPVDFEARRGKSLGMQLISDLARQLGGRLDIGPGPGSRFQVVFPRVRQHSTGTTLRPPA